MCVCVLGCVCCMFGGLVVHVCEMFGMAVCCLLLYVFVCVCGLFGVCVCAVC